MNFVLQGRDQLSRVLDRAGDSANRLHRRISAATTNSSSAINRFVTSTSTRMAALDRNAGASKEAFEALGKSALSLAPAVIPVAAAMAPLVASTAAAGVAVGVYTAALGPQVAAMSEAAKAEEKYQDAVETSGRTSKEAVKAQAEYAAQMAKLPPATRQAAAQMAVLKDTYQDWSEELAKDTMAPFTKGLALTSSLLPKLTPLVKGTSAELDRMVTIVGGGMASPGFDRLLSKFTEFSTGALARANDSLIRFMRTLDTGEVGGGIEEFLDYARAQGPVVADTMRNIGRALMNVLQAASGVGVGMLQVVNALSKLVAAVPPGAISLLLQLAIAMKVVKLAALGLAAAKGAAAAFGVQIIAMRAAAAGTPGRLSAVAASINSLSRSAKLAIAGSAIGLLVIALTELAQIGKKAPVDVDRMTTSMGQFAKSGKLSGEAAKVMGKDFKEFDEALKGMTNPGTLDRWQQSFTKFFGQDSTPVKRWKSTLDDVDKSLANLVKSGNADTAAQAFSLLAARAREQGMSTADLRKQLGDYRSALEDQKFEQELAARSMGLFGAQAQATQQKLAAQKLSADGLRQSIQALNDVNRSALGGMIGFEAAIDASTKAAKENAGALKMTGGQLDLSDEKSRTAAQALTDLAAKTDEATASARDSGASWQTVSGIYEKGRKQLIANAMQMGLNRDQARRLADQILKTPDKTAKLRGNLDDLKAKLADAKSRLSKVPDSRKAQVRAEIKDLEAKIRKAKSDLASLKNKTVTITTKYVVVGDSSAARKSGAEGSQLKNAKGGLIRGPGTGTSDSIVSRVSNGEFVVRASSVSKYGVDMLRAINEGRLDKQAVAGGKAAMAPVVGRPAAVGHVVQPVHVQIDVSGALDPVATAKEIQKALLTLKRHGGVNINLGVA